VNGLNFSWSRRLPVVLQTEVAECGVACLAMILSFHGQRVDLGTLRRRYAVSLKGTTLNDLTNIAGAVGLATRALRLELSELPNLRTPCILHWSLNHFVVLARVHGKSITIHDPARGKRRISLEEASREFTGVALEAVPTKTFTREKQPRLGYGYLLGSLGDLRGMATTVILLSVCLEIVALLMPIGGQVIVDEVITSSDYDLLLVVAAGVALLLLVQLAVEVARSWTLAVVQTTLSLHWSSSLFDQMMRLPLEFFAKRHVGDVISRFGSLAIVQKALTTDVILSLFDGVMSIGMLIMLFLYGGWLAGIALFSTCLNAVLRVLAYRVYRQGTEEAIIHDARQQTHFIETVRGIASVKLLGLTDRRRAGWVNHFVDSLNAKFRLLRLDLLFGRANDLLAGTDRLLLLVLGARMVMSGTMSLGMLVAFLAYRDQFATRVQNLIGTGFQLKMLSLQLTRLADIVMAEPEREIGRATDVSAISSISFLGEALHAEKLSFRYGDNESWVFRNLSLDILPGTCVAITGPSGCGKTTLLKILMGLIRPTEGVVSCSGININALGSAAYRERIAGVLQDDGLFAGSLADNICGFDNHPDPEWMTECADRAAILEDIRQMPMGFETLVGDMGSTLSGGQKQRVILARALYRRPAILFLDEATSHLDEATEAVVAEALRGLRITRVIVAHRPATIAHADSLIKLESFGQSRHSSVGSTGRDAPRPSRLPAAARTIRDTTQPLSLGPLRKSSETLENQAKKTVVDADALDVVTMQAQEGKGLAEEATERTFPDYMLKILARPSRAVKLRASALALAGAAIAGGVPTLLLMRGGPESVDVNVVNPEQELVDPSANASVALSLPPGTAPAHGIGKPPGGTSATPVDPESVAATESSTSSASMRPTGPPSNARSEAALTARAWLDSTPAPASVPSAVDVTQAVGVSAVSAPAAVPPNAVPSLPQFRDTGSTTPPPDEAPIATQVPSDRASAESPSPGGAPPALIANPASTTTSETAQTAKASLDGAPGSLPAVGGVTQPALGLLSAPPGDQKPNATPVSSTTDFGNATFAGRAPIPPARPAETEISDSARAAKESVRGRGLLSKHRHEISSQDAVDRATATVPGTAAEKHSHPLAFRTRTKPEQPARAGKGAQDAAEPPGVPDVPAAPGPQSNSASPRAVDSLEPEAPAPSAEYPAGNRDTR
jgi:ATP-binding cassette subfamily B protein RaxB